MNNKLFCTFVTKPLIEDTIQQITQFYEVFYNKIFILSLEGEDSFICTYNTDLSNVKNFIQNTILVHRKKDTNTLYTINALNQLIRDNNNGILNKKFNVNWNSYQNTILLTRENNLQILKTTLVSIVRI